MKVKFLGPVTVARLVHVVCLLDGRLLLPELLGQECEADEVQNWDELRRDPQSAMRNIQMKK